MRNKKRLLETIIFAALSWLSIACADAAVLVVTSTSDVSDPPRLTLREAIAKAAPGDTICFDPSLDGQRIVMRSGPLEIQKNLTITAASLSKGIVIDRNKLQGSIIEIFTPVTVLLEHLTLTGTNSGAAVNGQGSNITITNCQIVDNRNQLQAEAAGVRTLGNRLTIEGSIIARNHPVAIDAVGTLEMSECTVVDNGAEPWAVKSSSYLPTGNTTTILNSSFSNNNGNPAQGSSTLSIWGYNTIISSSSFSNNTGVATIWRHEYYLPNSAMELTKCTISDNHGSAIWNDASYGKGSAGIHQCTIRNNIGYRTNVGGIKHAGGEITVDNSIIADNRGGDVGGISIVHHIVANTHVLLRHSTISGNSAIYGDVFSGAFGVGGILVESAAGGAQFAVEVESCTVANNNATGFLHGAGGVFCYGGYNKSTANLTLNRCTISGNSCDATRLNTAGGVVAKSEGEGPIVIAINNCTISGNRSLNQGAGGIFFASSRVPSILSLNSSTITQNQAAEGGGVFVRPGPLAHINVHNTAIAGNDDTAEIAPDISASVVSQGYNLIGKIDGSSGWIDTDQTGDISSPLDPILGKLADNGGPTQTHALLKGSPAINTGDPKLVGTVDQRGVPRDKYPDIGSYEAK